MEENNITLQEVLIYMKRVEDKVDIIEDRLNNEVLMRINRLEEKIDRIDQRIDKLTTKQISNGNTLKYIVIMLGMILSFLAAFLGFHWRMP